MNYIFIIVSKVENTLNKSIRRYPQGMRLTFIQHSTEILIQVALIKKMTLKRHGKIKHSAVRSRGGILKRNRDFYKWLVLYIYLYST